MYLIVDKKTNAILHMSNSFAGEDKRPEEILPSFDPATMTFGRAPEQFIPASFTIVKGVVKDAAPAAAAPAETVAQARERIVSGFTHAALSSRRQLIPDHQLMNAGLGLYDDERVEGIRATVQAFRDEVQRLEKAAAKAKSLKELEAIKPAFPTEVVTPKPAGKGK
jgi:hypothetical protein